jgi:hypothetical protein
MANKDSESLTLKSMHSEFRHLMMLLVLACAYNSNGLPLLSDDNYKSNFSTDDYNLYRRVTHHGVLNALATLFVRDHEVIATMDITSRESVDGLLTSMQVKEGDIDADIPIMTSSASFKNHGEEDPGFPKRGNHLRFLPAGKPLQVAIDVDHDATELLTSESWTVLFRAM